MVKPWQNRCTAKACASFSGLPGVQLYHLLDGLYDEADIRFIPVRHEQATTYMADGYARASGGIGTALVVPGPGLQNASAGIGTAYSASSPILVVSGQIQRDFIGVDRGMQHEVNDQLDTIRPVTKWTRADSEGAGGAGGGARGVLPVEDRAPASGGNRDSPGNAGRNC